MVAATFVAAHPSRATFHTGSGATILQNPGLPKGVESKAHRIGGGIADNHMVEQLDVEGLGRLPELACDLHVCT